MKILKSKGVILLVLGLIMIQFSCKNEQEKNLTKSNNLDEVVDHNKTEREKNAKSESLDEVVIHGTTDDIAAFKYFNLIRFSGLGYTPKSYPERKGLLADSLMLTLENITKPQLVDLIAISQKGDSVPYVTRIMLTPGDSISIKINQGEMSFFGKNEAHYNFFLELNNESLEKEWAVYKNDPFLYKEGLLKAYSKKKSYLDNYIKENPEASKNFKNLIGSELKFEYLYHLMLPRNIWNEYLGHYTNNKKDIVFVHLDNNWNKEKFLDLEKYYEGITFEDFKRPDLLNNDYFRRTLVLYIRHYFANHTYLEYSRTNFLEEKRFIQKNLKGKLETYAISRLINDYYMKGFGKGEEDITLLKDLIEEYKEEFSDPSYSPRIEDILYDLKSYEFKLPQIVLNEKVLTFSGDTITLNEILQNSRNQIKVLDFWAGWCAPCISEIKTSKEYKQDLKNKENVRFIYLSIDEENKRWLDQVAELKDNFSEEDQYWIINKKSSQILRQMLIRENSGKTYFSIPRYTILNSNNRIISNNAPSPTDTLSFSRLIRNIEE